MVYSPANSNNNFGNKHDDDITSKEAGNEVKRMVEDFERKLARQ